jgi:hypothetical protein
MSPFTIFAIILGVCALNGMFSPFLRLSMAVVLALLPEWFPPNIHWLLFFGAVFLSSLTLVVGGIPAALYERLWEGEPFTGVSMYIWLACCVLLTLPALTNLPGLR